MKASLVCRLLLGAVCFFAIPSKSEAKLQIGKMLKMAGANATVNGEKVAVEVPLFWGDRLITGPDTTLNLVLYPAFSIKIRPSSEVKLIGNLIESKGQTLMSTAAVQAIKGKIQASVFKTDGLKNAIQIIGRKTMSSIRGTTFEVDVESSEEMYVEEGEVLVETLADNKKVEVTSGRAFDVKIEQPVEMAREPIVVVGPEVVKTEWKAASPEILSSHQKEAKKYHEMLNKDVASARAGLVKDIKGMFKSTKGTYDQFKKKK